MENKRLIVIFKEIEFILDYEGTGTSTEDEEVLYKAFDNSLYDTLFDFGFKVPQFQMSEGLSFLHLISTRFIDLLVHTADLEIKRDNIDISLVSEETEYILSRLPYSIGMEYVDDNWLEIVWEGLLCNYKNDLCNFSGTVTEYLSSKRADLTVP